MKHQKKIKIAIDSPAAAGAGTLAKSLSSYYNLLYLDTGKIYRMIAYIKLKNKKNFKNRNRLTCCCWSWNIGKKNINTL